jgi:hypothetical protein
MSTWKRTATNTHARDEYIIRPATFGKGWFVYRITNGNRELIAGQHYASPMTAQRHAFKTIREAKAWVDDLIAVEVAS